MNLSLRVNGLNDVFERVLEEWGGSALLLFLRLDVAWAFLQPGNLTVSCWSSPIALFHDE
jgi:hypothetical protein